MVGGSVGAEEAQADGGEGGTQDATCGSGEIAAGLGGLRIGREGQASEGNYGDSGARADAERRAEHGVQSMERDVERVEGAEE